MRRFMVIPLAGLLVLGAAAPVLAGPNVSNTSGSGKTIYGEWSSAGTYGYVFLGEETGYGGFGEIYQESGEYVECAPVVDPGTKKNASVPQDTTPPGEGFYGFVGTRTYGWAFDLEITLSRRLETGTATGSAELYTETINECEGIYGGDPVAEIVPLKVSVAGVGSLASFRGSGSYKIPSEFNGHESYRGTERQATGFAVAGETIDATFDFAYMSLVTWSQHVNN
jgi:hypothetical protein